jgi:hypothetical protein
MARFQLDRSRLLYCLMRCDGYQCFRF